MPKLEWKTTVTPHHGGKYFRTQVPRELALELGLFVDGKKQRLKWQLQKGKAVVEKR